MNNQNNSNYSNSSQNMPHNDIIKNFTTTFSQISNNITKMKDISHQTDQTIDQTIDHHVNQNQDNFDGYEQHGFLLNPQVDEPFLARLYATKLVDNKILPTCLNDTVIIPQIEGERLLLGDNMIVDISFGDNHVIAHVIDYTAPNRTIQMPNWMFEKINALQNDLLKIESANIKKITNIKVTAPKEITNSLGVLEFHLRHRHVLYTGEQIVIKMFEKTYVFTIDEIYNGKEKLSTGLLYDNGPTTEIKFDLVVF